MTTQTFIERIMRQVESGDEIDWKELRKEIVERHRKASSEAEWVLFLRAHKALLDAVERQNLVTDLVAFRKTRLADYRALLVSEAATVSAQDGLVDPTVMHAITAREVAEGRMAEDDEFHTLSVAGARVLGPSSERRAASPGLLSKVRSLFTRH